MTARQQSFRTLCVLGGAGAIEELLMVIGDLACDWPDGLSCVVIADTPAQGAEIVSTVSQLPVATQAYSGTELRACKTLAPNTIHVVVGDNVVVCRNDSRVSTTLESIENTGADSVLQNLASQLGADLVVLVLSNRENAHGMDLAKVACTGAMVLAHSSIDGLADATSGAGGNASANVLVEPLATLFVELRMHLIRRQLASAHQELASTKDALRTSHRENSFLKDQLQTAHNGMRHSGALSGQTMAGATESPSLSPAEHVSTLELLRKSELEARELTRELEDLYRNAPIGLCVLNREFRYLRINERMAELNGLPAAEHLGRTVRDILPELADAAEPALQAVFDSGEPAFDIELVGETPAAPGVKRTWLEQWLPIRGGDGSVVALNIVAEEITERKLAESRLQEAECRAQEARAAAEAANGWKSLFLANMSHEIRTPLAAILGYSDLLAARLTDPDDLKGIQTIRRNGQHLLTLLNDILDLSRIEAGLLTLERAPFSPLDLLREVKELMQVPANERRLELALNVVSTLPAKLVGDVTRLRQILVNLVGNAIKFTERGGVTMRVMLDREEQVLVFDVIDTGIGIEQSQMKNIFDVFTQADGSIARRFGGTGLGLAISQRLITELGGMITVESSPGKGSTFTLTLPLSEEALHELVVADEVPVTRASRLHIPRTLDCRLLVVDDLADIRTIVQAILEQAGASVTALSSGRAALRWVAKAPVDEPIEAIVLDMHMPGFDGYECAAELRRRGYTAPIVALTAKAMVGERDKCLAAGCSDYLSKPIDAGRLVEVLHHQLEQVTLESGTPFKSHEFGNSDPKLALPEGGALRVLLVEDSDDLARPLVTLLERRGFVVDRAADVMTARSLALASQPDVLVTDIGLPDGTGYDLVEYLRTVGELSDTVFVAMSGSVADKERSEIFHHHLLKPIGASELVALLLRITHQ